MNKQKKNLSSAQELQNRSDAPAGVSTVRPGQSTPRLREAVHAIPLPAGPQAFWSRPGDDDSLIVCDLTGSWRYHIQSCPARRPPQPPTARRRPAATPPASAGAGLVWTGSAGGQGKRGRSHDPLASHHILGGEFFFVYS